MVEFGDENVWMSPMRENYKELIGRVWLKIQVQGNWCAFTNMLQTANHNTNKITLLKHCWYYKLTNIIQ